jgi:hypothetical protein
MMTPQYHCKCAESVRIRSLEKSEEEPYEIGMAEKIRHKQLEAVR